MVPELTTDELKELVAADSGRIGLRLAGRYLTGGDAVALARDIQDVIKRIRAGMRADAADPSATFSAWIEDGPRLAKAAGVYVGISIFSKDPNA